MKSDLDFPVVWVLSCVLSVVQLPGDGLADVEEESAHRTATAIRIKGAPPKLDGVLDDDIWRTAPLLLAITQTSKS